MTSLHWHGLSLLALATTLVAQVTPEHAIVITAQTTTPKSVLLDVDLKTGKFTTLGRFTFDGFPPLGVHIDPIDDDLIVAIEWPGGSRLLRLTLNGSRIASQRVLADIKGRISDLDMGLGDTIVFTIGGATGGLYAIPRNGGVQRRIAPLPRAAAIFSYGHATFAGLVLQTGAAGKPVVDPRAQSVQYTDGKTFGQLRLQGYRPVHVTDIGVLPNALPNYLIANADGTVGEIASQAQLLRLTPAIPAGGSRRLKIRYGGSTAILLGGKADPRIKSFPGFGNGPNRTVTFLTGNLPGDPVDLDLAAFRGAKAIGLGHSCRFGPMVISTGRGGPPRIGNAQFVLQLFRGTANAPIALVLGVSDDKMGNLTLPVTLAGGCPLYTSVEALILTRTDNLGIATQALPVPNNPALAGAVVYAQWAQLQGPNFTTSGAMALHLDR